MHTVFVTGVNGFVGKHLVRELLSRGARVVGVGREPEMHQDLVATGIDYFACDLMDSAGVQSLPWERATAIISLAGLAQVGGSFSQPEIYKSINVGVLTNVCEVLLAKNPQCRVLAVSTGAVYASDQPMPLSEDSALTKAGSPYAESKILMEQAVGKFSQQGLRCIVARPLNHVGPGQESGFLLPDLYTNITGSVKTGEAVAIGNLSTRRDYTDVRDVVRAYADLCLTDAKNLKHDLYNICSGSTHSGEELVRSLMASIPGAAAVRTVVDQALIRANDPVELVGSASRIHEDIGWAPTIPFATTVQDYVTWRLSLKN